MTLTRLSLARKLETLAWPTSQPLFFEVQCSFPYRHRIAPEHHSTMRAHALRAGQAANCRVSTLRFSHTDKDLCSVTAAQDLTRASATTRILTPPVSPLYLPPPLLRTLTKAPSDHPRCSRLPKSRHRITYATVRKANQEARGGPQGVGFFTAIDAGREDSILAS
jgi:hypothetical protein